MFRTSLAAMSWGCVIALAMATAVQAEVPKSDLLFPAATKAYVSIADFPDAIDKFNRTPLGRMLADPALEAFNTDLRRQLDGDKGTVSERLGMPLEDLEGLPSGEVSLGLVELPGKKPGGIALFDVTKNVKETQAALKKADARLKKEDAKHVEQKSKAGSVDLQVYTIPPKGERKEAVTAIYFLHDGLLGISDSLDVVEDILARWINQTKDGLNTLEAYRKVIDQGNRSGLKADVHWYVDPLATLAAAQANMKKSMGGRDLAKDLTKEFGAIKAAGGVVAMGGAPNGLLHSSFVWAPRPFERGMKMFEFPNTKGFEVPDWVPAKLASFTAFNWDILNAFKNFGTVFDLFVGEGEEGVWRDVLESIETDPNGPQLNLEKDLVAHLGTRCILMIDTQMPVGPYSQRRLFAAQAKNEDKLSKAVERAMEGDKAVKIHEVEVDGKTYKIFEMVPEDEEIPEVQVLIGDQKHAATAKHAPHQAVTVANGWMFISTHIELLVELIKTPKAAQPLANDKDFAQVIQQCQALHPGDDCMQIFTRDDERMFLAYELFRQGKLPEADLPIADAMNAIFGQDLAEGEIRKARLDGSKLPDYSVVRKYFHNSGMFSSTEADGWFMMGFSLDKNPAAVAAGK